MEEFSILARIFFALAFGAIIGLETETRAKEEHEKHKKTLPVSSRLGGMRTYTVLSLFGAVAGILYISGVEAFAYIMFIAVSVIVAAAYILNIYYRQAFGMTTEIGILITVLISFAATAGIVPLELLLVLIILLVFVLSQKNKVKLVTNRVDHGELMDIIEFTVIALVILPFLPNTDITVEAIPGLTNLVNTFQINISEASKLVVLNPFQLWQYVVLISGFNLAGYFASKFFGSGGGLLFTSVIGGFISSTATTITNAVRSKQELSASPKLAAGALIANAVSFLQILVLAATAGIIFFKAILPTTLGFMIGSFLVAGWFFFKSNQTKKTKRQKVEVGSKLEPFALRPAIRFAVILTVVKFIVQIVNLMFADKGLIIVTSISGFLGMDVATISLGELLQRGEIGVEVAVLAFIAVNTVNYIAKVLYSRIQGNRNYSKVILIGLLASLIIGVASYFFTAVI